MARRRDLERIYQARRAGLMARLMSAGVAADRAEGLLAAWEATATANGLVRDGAAYWDEAWPWLEPRRWTKPSVAPKTRAPRPVGGSWPGRDGA